ncbi:SRPBCC family protein [Epilithonimonas tenax]|uniref:SRPBCC family protein n=1 Tax=Epilithonimonas tenax TaxID=191577 RepID=UPI00041EBF6D|nr:SRPBCC family protein [Epilithonimonas tenax]
MVHRLYREQQINCDIETTWKFFSAASNLAIITPPEMNFTVLTKLKNDEIYEGMIIDYTVSPLLNIPMKWQTEITQVDFQKSFTDFQKKGPYKLWNHFHEFVLNEDGVLIKDTVTYELPFGFLGELAHSLFVKKKLEGIFKFRNQVLEVMFNSNRENS